MNKINFAIIGCGHIGKRHAEMIMQNTDANLVALCDTKSFDSLNLNNFNQPFFQDIDSLLSSGIKIDVVNICTPNGLHAEHALKALASGLHVVIEKPMALNVADCDKIIEVATANQKKVFCVMQNRFSPPSVWLKNMVSGGILGNLFMVQVNCFWNRDERYYHNNTWHGDKKLDGGTLFTQFSHFIDTMLWLFGDIENIHGEFEDFNHQQLTDFEDSGIVTFHFKNGGIGTLNYSTSVYDRNLESSIKIIAQNGSIEVGGQYMNEVKHCHVKGYTMQELPPTAEANNYGSYTGSAANHHYIITNIIDALQRNAPIATTAAEGKSVVEVIENIYAMRSKSFTKNK
jgi:UDP-N-acetyl-2-amino-2-deoxyglucuronate dehydrogenase